MKVLKTIGILGAAAWVWSKYRSSSRAAEKIDVTISGERVGINYQGVPVVLSYVIKNPTKARMELTSPLIKIKVDKKLLASSTISVADIPLQNRSSKGRIMIEPFSQTEKINVTIPISFIGLLQLGKAFYDKFKNGNAVQIEVETNAQVYTELGNFPYDDITKMDV